MCDNKSLLNQYCQKKRIALPVYNSENTGGGFSCMLTLEEEEFNSLSTHSTKKDAEKDVANVAVRALLKHNSARTFEDMLKNLGDLSISGPRQQPTVTTSALLTNGHSPLTSTVAESHSSLTSGSHSSPTSVTGGRVIGGVYYPMNTHSVAPPPGFPSGTSRPLTQQSHHSQPLRPTANRPDLPVSINGPSIDHPQALNKPSGAVPMTMPTFETTEQTPQQLRGLAPDKDVQDLEYYCTMSGLPSPIYTIYREKGRHKGRVKIGEMEFGRGWGFESFDEAKDSAAVVAIAGLALTQMRWLAQQGKAIPKGGPPQLTSVNIQHSPPVSPSSVATHQPARTIRPLHTPQSSPASHPLTTTNLPRQVAPRAHLPPVHPQAPPPTQPSPFTQAPLPTQPSPFTQTPPPTQPSPFTQAPPLTQPSPFTQTPPPTQPSPFTQAPPPTQPNNLHTPAYFQYPVARGSSQSTAPPLSTSPSDRPPMAADYKSLLNTYCQKNHYPYPTYECSSPSDAAGYISTVTVNGLKYKSRVHGTKKAADADAAKVAMEILGGTSEQSVGTNSVQVITPAPTTSTATVTGAIVSYKNLLQEKAQKERQPLPQYSTERVDMGFVSTVTVYSLGGLSFKEVSPPYPSKKVAEQEAAKLACKKLQMI